MTVVYDEFTIELARTLPWRIETVAARVKVLADAGATAHDVELWLGRIARGEVTIVGTILALQQL